MLIGEWEKGFKKEKIIRIMDVNCAKVRFCQSDVLSSVEGDGFGRDVSVPHLGGSHLFPLIFNITFTFLFFGAIFDRRLPYLSCQPRTEAFKSF